MSITDDFNRLNEILYSGLSNDIAGPVNVILNSAEHLERRLRDQPDLLDIVYAIYDSGRFLARLGTHVVELAACFSDGNVPNMREVNLREQLCYLLEQTAPYALRRQVTLCWDMNEMPATYPLCDPVMLDDILIKLLSNVIRYSSPDGKIWVTVTAAEGRTRICIRDSGPGIPPQIFSAVLSPQSSQKERGISSFGAGLGLYLANEFCRVMGWKLKIESVEGGGTMSVIETGVCGNGLSGTAIFSAESEAEREIFRCEQRGRVRTEMASLFGRLPEPEEEE